MVVLSADRCLILRRGSEWVFPEGHLEDRERPADAAVREVREETGFEVVIEGYVGDTRYAFGSVKNAVQVKRVDWYWGRPVGRQPAPR